MSLSDDTNYNSESITTSYKSYSSDLVPYKSGAMQWKAEISCNLHTYACYEQPFAKVYEEDGTTLVDSWEGSEVGPSDFYGLTPYGPYVMTAIFPTVEVKDNRKFVYGVKLKATGGFSADVEVKWYHTPVADSEITKL